MADRSYIYAYFGLTLLHVCGSYSQTLKLAFIVFRHGDRTTEILTTYPKNPYIHETYYPYGHGQLTMKGKERMYTLGKKLRNRYDSFVDAVYIPDDLYAASTTFSRTQTSLQLVLAGLYPPHSTDLEWNANLNWNPIAFTTNEEVLDIPFFNNQNYKMLYMNYLNSKQGRDMDKKYRPWYKYLSRHSGLNVTSLKEVFFLYFCFLAEEEWGMKLPLWSAFVYPHTLMNAAMDFYDSLSATSELKQLYGGALLKIMTDTIHSKLNGTLSPSTRKMYLYSGHDHNVISLLKAMEVYFPHLPPYGACIMIELIQKESDWYIQVLYDDSSSTVKQLIVPGCDAYCPFQTFMNRLKANLPLN